ncbi:hypothetical protein JT136_01490 [Helicobacter pylori]|nr:hypothetical protein [Helicobacter pylori]MCQ2843161.1 hypothetical protein [Helicobacter pylori]MCQ2847428.1 hypothetical protein [Helicobacter pylori]MCQ2853523.1 hypothetical protein [Helicobacter pylori]
MKKLDFSGGFLSVISGNVILKYPLRVLQPKLKRSQQAIKPHFYRYL